MNIFNRILGRNKPDFYYVIVSDGPSILTLPVGVKVRRESMRNFKLKQGQTICTATYGAVLRYELELLKGQSDV